MTFVEALSDPQLFGGLPEFEDLSTWRRWLVFWKAVDGLELDSDELAIFRHHTGRSRPREGGYPEGVAEIGVQSGKSHMAAVRGAYRAAQALVAGERGIWVPLVAQGVRGAQRALFRYARQAIHGSPLLKREIVRETRTTIELTGGVSVGVYPCKPASVRGIRAACAIVDELAFFVSTEGNPADAEMLRAMRTRLAATDGELLILSSPHAMAGALWSLHRKHHGRDDSPTLVWRAASHEMNPTISRAFLDRLREEDPEAYRNEVEAEFRAGISTFIDPVVLDDRVEDGVRERAPESGVRYRAFVDAASGSGKDSFAVGVAHRDGERAVLDVVRAWRPPFNPSGVIEEAAELLARYGVKRPRGDRYASGFLEEGFRQHGVRYEAAKRTTSDTYLEFLPLVNAGTVVLLDHPALVRELRSLERRTGRSGKDRVDHRPGSHDDRAVAAAGALVAATERSYRLPLKTAFGNIDKSQRRRRGRRLLRRDPAL